jgi:hypothetical protein
MSMIIPQGMSADQVATLVEDAVRLPSQRTGEHDFRSLLTNDCPAWCKNHEQGVDVDGKPAPRFHAVDLPTNYIGERGDFAGVCLEQEIGTKTATVFLLLEEERSASVHMTATEARQLAASLIYAAQAIEDGAR